MTTGQLRDLENQPHQLKRLVELSVTLNSTLDLDDLLRLITATAAELLDCEAASILLYDEKDQRLFFAAATGSDPAQLAQIPVPIENSLAGTIFRTNQHIILNDAEHDSRHYSLVSDHIQFSVKTLLGVPMPIKDRTVGVPVACETLSRGRTLGKLVLGLRTVRDDAGPITFRHALTRGLVAVVEVYLLWGLPAVVSCVVTPQGKRIGDIAAGTYVVRDRVRASLPAPVPMPPHLATWARSADMGALPDSLSATVRSFLPAAFTMTAAAREQMGRDLLGEVLRYVSPPPPAGNHPEYVLAAVLADRRRRDVERLRRDAALRQRLLSGDPLAGADRSGLH